MLGWLTGRGGRRETSPITEWRKAWAEAVETPQAARLPELRHSLESLASGDDDLEIEREMADGLSDLIALDSRLRAGNVPVIQTGHRVAASDVCHFSVPASMPDHPAQPSGRVLWTNRRALFAGGGHSMSLGWHRVGAVRRIGRDLLLVLRGAEITQRFRFNSYADALCGAAIARHLAPPSGQGS